MCQKYEEVRRAFTILCVGLVGNARRVERLDNAPKEFDMLCADERVHIVNVKRAVLYVGTFPLIFYAPDDEPRGLCEFVIAIDPATRAISCMSVEGVKSDGNRSGPHPHVMTDGQPCLADGKQKIANWFADGKLARIAIYMMDFLELARGSNDYVSPTAWRALTGEEVRQCLQLRRRGTS